MMPARAPARNNPDEPGFLRLTSSAYSWPPRGLVAGAAAASELLGRLFVHALDLGGLAQLGDASACALRVTKVSICGLT
jgi:hypothetical protein